MVSLGARFLSNLKAPAPRHFEDLEEEDKSAKKTKGKRKKAAPLPIRPAPAGATFKNEQREPEAQEIALPRTLGGASANKLAAAGAAKAPSNTGVGKAAAKKKVLAAPAGGEADGWTVNVTKAQKQREKRKEKPQAAAAPPVVLAAPEVAPVDQAPQ